MYPIINYPYSSKLNDRLYDTIIQNLSPEEAENDTSVGRRTVWDLHKQNIRDVDLLTTWIKNIVSTKHVLIPLNNESAEDYEDSFNFNSHDFKMTHCWGLIYDKGQSMTVHNHFPFTLSFVYGVRMPRGSAPLILGNKKINLKEGQCVFFLSHTMHRVPSHNRSERRCVVAGNLLYELKDM